MRPPERGFQNPKAEALLQASTMADLRDQLDNYGCHTAKSTLDDKLTDNIIGRLATNSTAFAKVSPASCMPDMAGVLPSCPQTISKVSPASCMPNMAEMLPSCPQTISSSIALQFVTALKPSSHCCGYKWFPQAASEAAVILSSPASHALCPEDTESIGQTAVMSPVACISGCSRDRRLPDLLCTNPHKTSLVVFCRSAEVQVQVFALYF